MGWMTPAPPVGDELAPLPVAEPVLELPAELPPAEVAEEPEELKARDGERLVEAREPLVLEPLLPVPTAEPTGGEAAGAPAGADGSEVKTEGSLVATEL